MIRNAGRNTFFIIYFYKELENALLQKKDIKKKAGITNTGLLFQKFILII